MTDKGRFGYAHYVQLRTKAPSLASLLQKRPPITAFDIGSSSDIDDDFDDENNNNHVPLKRKAIDSSITLEVNNASLSVDQINKPKRKAKVPIEFTQSDEDFKDIAPGTNMSIKEQQDIEISSSDKIKTARTSIESSSSSSAILSSPSIPICCVCFQKDGSIKSSRMLTCDECQESIHSACYGDFNNGPLELPRFLCDKCDMKRSNLRVGLTSNFKCNLCLQPNGLMKRAINGKLIHLLCAVHCRELPLTPTMQVDLSELDPERQDLYCRICTLRGGGVIQCAFSRCLVSFHPFCANSNGLMTVLRASDEFDVLKQRKGVYETYCCADHATMCRRQGVISIVNDELIDQNNITKTKVDQFTLASKSIHNRSVERHKSATNSSSAVVMKGSVANYSQESPTGLFNTQVNFQPRKSSKHGKMKRFVC